jgi:hypothetical protein
MSIYDLSKLLDDAADGAADVLIDALARECPYCQRSGRLIDALSGVGTKRVLRVPPYRSWFAPKRLRGPA